MGDWTADARYARRRLKVADEIQSELRHDIVSGRLAPGERLPTERALAHRFGVSQASVREACRSLEAQGLIDIRHGRGLYVADDFLRILTDAVHTTSQIFGVGLLEVVDLRVALGRHLASLAAANATDSDINAVAVANDAIASAATLDPPTGAADRAAAFQLAVAAASHHALSFALERVLSDLLRMLQETVLTPLAVDEHWQRWSNALTEERSDLLAALRLRDSSAAAAAASRYLEHLWHSIADDPDLASVRLSDRDLMDEVAAKVVRASSAARAARTRPPSAP